MLSFLWPGLGQFYAGRRRVAAVFAVPAVLALLVLLYQMRQGPEVFAARLVSPRFALAAFVIVVFLGGWRVVAVAQAFVAGRALDTRRTLERAVLGALVATIVLTHSAAGYTLWITFEAGSKINQPNPELVDLATPTLAPGVTPGPSSSAVPTGVAPRADNRVTILFNGVDSSTTRQEHLY
ncbi:MAG: hypothetical protein ACXWN4_05940, partial [Candidatus Limnocylindrales bacterium]